MPSISLTAFLKILTKGSPQKVREYSRYLTPGGYDFYWQLKEAAHALTVGGETFADCAKPIQESSREVERKHNLDNLKSLQRWITKTGVTKFFDPPAGLCTSPAGFVTIKLEPEFGVIFKDERRIVQLWSAKGSNLTRSVAQIGLYLLQQHLCVGDHANSKAGILDVRKRELYVADAFPRSIEAIVSSELAWLDGFFKMHAKAA